MQTTIVSMANLSPEEDRRQRFHVQLLQDGRNISLLLDLLAIVAERQDWRRLRDRLGRELTFRAYVELPYSEGGIGWTVKNLETVMKLQHDKERPGREDPPTVERMETMRGTVRDLLNGKALPNGGDRKSVLYHNTDTPVEKQGTSADYTLRRLKRDNPGLAARVISGELSANAAAVSAGFRKKTLTVPAEPSAVARTLRRHFNQEDLAEIIRLLCEKEDT